MPYQSTDARKIRIYLLNSHNNSEDEINTIKESAIPKGTKGGSPGEHFTSNSLVHLFFKRGGENHHSFEFTEEVNALSY